MLKVRTRISALRSAPRSSRAERPPPLTPPTRTPKWCKGIKIAAFPGGPQGGVFANNVYNGDRQAELDLGPSVTYYFSNWDPNTMLNQLQQAIATKVDGIAFMGHPGDDASDPQSRRPSLRDIFTTANTCCPRRKKDRPQGMGYVGALNHAAGFALGAEAAKQPHQGGRRASSGVSRAKPATADRACRGDRGDREAAGKAITRRPTRPPTRPELRTATFVGVMKANRDQVVVTDHGALTSNVGVYARAASLKPGQVDFACFDMSPNTAKAVKEGHQNY